MEWHSRSHLRVEVYVPYSVYLTLWRVAVESGGKDFTVKLGQDTLTQHANRNQVKTQRNSDGEPELKIRHLHPQLKHMMWCTGKPVPLTHEKNRSRRQKTQVLDLTSVLSNCHKLIIMLYMAGEIAKSIGSLPWVMRIWVQPPNKANSGGMLSQLYCWEADRWIWKDCWLVSLALLYKKRQVAV